MTPTAHPVRFLASTPDAGKKPGSWNFGGYANARVDELLPMMLDEVTKTVQDEVAYVPTYVQPLVWGAPGEYRSDTTPR